MSGKNSPTDFRGRFIPDASWPPGRGAPEPLERVRRFLNTQNPESGADHFETPASLGGWLAGEGIDLRATPTAGDRRRAVLLRDTLRALAIANHDGGRSPERTTALAELDRMAARLPLVARFSGPLRLQPASDGVDAVLATVVAAVHDAMVTGEWARLKACRNHHCRWSFYDHSRNASGAWCSIMACGSRMKVRAHRARQRAARTAVHHEEGHEAAPHDQ